MKFYTSVNKRGNNILVRGYNNGKRFQTKVDYKPYLFLKTKDTESAVYRTIHDVPVKKKKFDSIKEARTFLERYKETEGIDIYGYTKFEYPFIYDTFIGPNGTGEVQFDPSLIRVASIDIEVGFNLDDDGNPSGGFPDPAKAENPVTAITLSLDGTRYVFGEGDFVPHQKNIRYFKCSNERSLLDSFLEIFSQLDPDVLTGWNIEGFDIPYLVNRINQLLGENQANRLSPWGLMEEKQIELRGKITTFYYPLGIAILDYMNLYKKFSYKNQESYKLDHIGFIELKMNKLDYSEYGTLYDLYLKNYQVFIEYNIHDTDIVDALENKMKFIQQVFSMAYSAGVNYGDALASVRPWEVICHNFLMGRRRVVPVKSPNHHKDEYEGGYVKEPQLGKHKWVISFDLNSLYPSIIRQCNISPECLKGKLDLGMTIQDLIKGDLNSYKDMMADNDVAMAANGTFYSRAKQGFMPELIEKMYGERVHFKNLMIEAQKKKNEIVKEIERRQLLSNK